MSSEEDVSPITATESPAAPCLDEQPGPSTTDESAAPVASEEPMEEQKEVSAPPTAPAAAAEQVTSPVVSPTVTSPSSNLSSENLGAQLLKNRFLSLKERANQNAQTLWAKNSPALSENAKAVQERAGQLWKTATPILPPVLPGFRMQPPGIFATAPSPAPPPTEQQRQQPLQNEAEDSGEGTAHKNVQNTLTEGRPLEQGIAELKHRQLSLADLSNDDKEPPKDKSEIKGAVDGGSGEDDTTSMGGASDVATLLLTGRALTRASLAATVAFESVATFRGRYNAASSSMNSSRDGTPRKSAEEETVTDSRPMPDSQLDIILKSRVGQHMQEILDKLEPHEYAMLLGRGMLGVNLKQCFLKNHGVFIDFMVPGGQAEHSGVIRSGDLPVRLGDIDLRKGTILDIPTQISQARRPVVLALATGSTVALERMNYVDVAVAMMHRAREYYHKRGTLSNLPSAASPPRGESNRGSSTPGDADIKSVSEITVPPADTIDSFLTPPAPNLDIRRDFQDEVPLRNMDKFLIEGLTQVYDLDSNFREAVRNAFLTCALDGRRLLFLSRHFSSGDKALVDLDPKMTPSAQLMLFLELTSFLDLYHVTSPAKLRQMASKIAYKFFLPTTVNNKLQLPLFDFHHIVPDASLRHLELVLNAKTESIPRDLFLDFSKAVVDSLAGAPFISFLTSSECARMRAYLRNTAPYINLPLQELMDAMTGKTNDAAAKNCFSYLLLFLICHVEKEPAGEYNFVGEEESKTRLLGAPNDICCAIFIRRKFIPALEAVKANLTAAKSDQECDASVIESAVKAIEHFWDNFIIGAVEQSSRRDEVENPFMTVRSELERVATEIIKAGEGDLQYSRTTGDIILKSKLLDEATVLAEEMVFNFAANVNPKFREHKFHEWMCNELSKLRAKDPTWSSKQEIPTLPHGCVKRLLRKADLPHGVSPHKPHREVSEESSEESHYPNAEFGVVFGSTVGNELAAEMQVPGIDSSDIRRYTCLPIALNQDHELAISGFSADDVIPPTFEGYATVPPQKPKPFQKPLGDSSISKDGWEVSLVSFTIPNAESSGASSALYGVSLFFQCKSDRAAVVRERIDSFAQDKESEPLSEEFVSPIKLRTTELTDSLGVVPGDVATRGLVKNVSVQVPLPGFNDQLKSSSWVSRVLSEEYRDSSHPISIGLALVSRKNVILAMRDTLSRLLFDYSRDTNGNTSTFGNCGPLVDVLGNFANRGVESISLRCILEPYLRAASAPWVDRPISSQASIFENQALHLVTDCLPPTALALMFIAALLEQKIILASSRRSILQSSTTALGTLLDPLKWSHLMVPLVPATLAGDLVQYPAPFILGIPSEQAQNEELIGNLPRDVTLVDLDVGRVILAPDFGLDNDMVRKADDPVATASALRSQVLYLAQTLGSIFGSRMKPQTWLCDHCSIPGTVPLTEPKPTDVEGLKDAAKSFITELLEGISACCYWIEEAAQTYGVAGEPTVLFDEDKFFEIKEHRASVAHKPLFPKATQGELALNLNDFDLVIESFLRCQSMSTYISSRPKTDMVFY